MKKTAHTIGIYLLCFVVAFVLLESGVRLFLPYKPISTEESLIREIAFNGRGGLAKNAQGMVNGALVRTSERRSILYAKPYDASKKSILFAGDGVTMGLSVASDSTFAGLLAAKLDTINVINTALVEYNGTDYEAVVDSFLNYLSPLEDDRVKVERVLVFWSLNDIYRDVPLSTIPGALSPGLDDKLRPYIKKHVRLYQVWKHRFSDTSRLTYERDAFYYAREGSYYQYALEKMRRIRDACMEKGVDLQVVLVPYEYQLRDHLPLDSLNAPQELFTADVEELGIRVMDGLEFMRGVLYDSEELFLYKNGVHFSLIGHRVFAEYLHTTVLTNGGG